MNIQQLEYIVAVDKYRHFLKASEACYITQATLSGMIKKLEEELNVILFDRSKHPVVPTDVGKKIVAQAKIALRETNRIKEIVTEDSGEIKGDIRIGIIPSLAPYLLPLFISDFTDTYKDIKVIINEMTTEKIKQKLKEGFIDVAILALPLQDKELIEDTLFFEEFFHYGELNVNCDKKKKFILPEDINFNKLLLLEEGHCLRDQVLNLCELRVKDSKDLRIEYQSGSIETLKQMVDLNLGSTILPELSLLTLNDKQKKKLNNFSAPYPVREIGLVCYSNYVKKNLIKALKKCILDNIPDKVLTKKDICVLPIK
ncbi:LysR substrate-binding domain-containing protein [Flavobacterium piscis]|uniref:LysR family hydrogen peroxide-inducible transcriptional activator n=1 Tax=Flavobacterium piscis TaxID=1114874 RepID=A0ABU1Y589_9FLAO|nr:LysR substrate-binding domain-containing protein [Flavobacterium piscis]MDR7209389.1 LysR family hydrogen peroxide-inducible transcriptional activator [Flavobacterium piscis]